MSITAMAEEIAPTIKKMIKAFEQNTSGEQIQSVAYKLRCLLVDKGMAYYDRVNSAYCGVHPDNRQGEMLVPNNVWELMVIVCIKKG